MEQLRKMRSQTESLSSLIVVWCVSSMARTTPCRTSPPPIADDVEDQERARCGHFAARVAVAAVSAKVVVHRIQSGRQAQGAPWSCAWRKAKEAMLVATRLYVGLEA